MTRKKILIVEDNQLNLKLFRDLLDAHDYDTVQTADGREARGLAEQAKPDLIIMDIQLPHISGLDLIKEFKADKKLRNIPIIAVTAFAMAEDEERIRAAGCEDYLAKPISIENFVQKIHKYL